MTFGLNRPSGSAASAQLSSTTSCERRKRDHTLPARYGATLIPMGPYRAFSRRAAARAAATVPPSPITDTAANCADPANVVADMTIGASRPNPAVRASTP
jgi:hypothetical protein